MKKNIYILAIGLVAQLAVYSPGYAQKKATAAKTSTSTAVKKSTGQLIPNDPNVKIGKLPNGLTYYIRKNTEPKNRAELYLATSIGSLMENDDQLGLAHFTEHMAFNGSKDFPKNDMINYLQKAGVRFGADLNAYTSFNQTVYQLPIPTDSASVFKSGFKILANWAGKITMDGEEIDKERGVIIEEDRQRGKNAQERMQKQMLPLILKGSRYENRLPIGKVELLQTFTHDKIRDFYKDWYRPNLQAVIAVGDFDVNEVEQLIKQNFSELANPANPRPRLAYDLPDNKEPLVKIITDPEQPYNIAQIMYKQRGGVVKTTEDFKKSLMYSMINSMISARFQEILQKGTPPFLVAQSSYGPFQGGLVPNVNAFHTVVVSSTAESLEKALAAGLAENERVVKFGFLPSELEVAKKNINAGNEKRLKEKDKTASAAFVQKYLNNFLQGTSIPSTEYSYELTKKTLEEISLAEINALAKTLLTKDNQIILVQAPEKDKAALPTEAKLLAVMKNAGNGVTPYVDNSINKPLLDKKPVAGKIVAEKKIDAVGVTELTLSNGIKVLLKPTDFKNDQIVFSSFGKGGTSLASNNDFRSAEMVSLIPESGVGEFNPSNLNKLLAGNTGSATAYVSDLYQGFSGGASPKDLETSFQLVYAYATKPRKDAEIFNKNMGDYKVILGSKGANPSSVFADTVQAVLSNYHERGMPMNLTDLDKISLDKAFAFYKDRFADLGDQTFVIVGAFDVEKIKPLIETYIASLPAAGKPQNFVDNGVNPPTGKISKTVYKGLEDKAAVELYIHGDYDYTPENNVQLEALNEALKIKILERLREKESGVYSPKVSLSTSKHPKAHYYFTISFSCAPANVDKLIAASLDEVNKIKQSGASTDDLAKFKSEEQRQMELSLRNNGFWLGYLAGAVKNGEPLDLVLQQPKLMEQVTVESTKASANKYLNENNYLRFVLLPQK
ncbi:M16 family metallopeptidase [Pedobacter gandavensis]|uniref:M16 family metallopeptidase n=1 Tax=Pedobacter gandavensis TaxID=2679963 RepID=UPI002930DD13|nr:insulinase family protein [Pedobacter gandavensis]